MVDEEKELTIPERQPKRITEEGKKALKSRLIISIVLIAIFLPCVILGDYFFMCLIFVGASITTFEITKSPQTVEKKFKNIIYVFAFLMILWLTYWVFIKNNLTAYYTNKEEYTFDKLLYVGFDSPFISIPAFAVCAAFFFVMMFIDESFTLHDAFYFIIMLFIVSIGFQSLLYIRYLPQVELLSQYSYLSTELNNVINADEISLIEQQLQEINATLSNGYFKYLQSACFTIYFFMGVCLSDVGGYFFGMLFGKHRMLPRISPKKTWEGFAGGFFLSCACTLTFAFLMAYNGYPLLNILTIDRWYNIIILSVLLPLIGSLGDLMFSAIKRSYNIKDFGQLLKSHGGLLDRLDSVLITAIACGAILPVMENAWLLYL